MKQAVQSLFTAIQRSRSSQAHAEIESVQAQGAPMTELTVDELRLVVGGDGNPGPHGSWGSQGAGA
jgi:hypothetical protein